MEGKHVLVRYDATISHVSILTTSDENSPTPLAFASLVVGEAVAAPGGTSTPSDPATKQLDNGCMEAFATVEEPPKMDDTGIDYASVSTTVTSSNTPPTTKIGEFQWSPQATQAPLSTAIKQKYKVTPHSKKGNLNTSTTTSNAFNALSNSDEEVESLIVKAQQSKKTIHPRLLGTSGRELKTDLASEANVFSRERESAFSLGLGIS